MFSKSKRGCVVFPGASGCTRAEQRLGIWGVWCQEGPRPEGPEGPEADTGDHQRWRLAAPDQRVAITRLD